MVCLKINFAMLSIMLIAKFLMSFLPHVHVLAGGYVIRAGVHIYNKIIY